MYKIVRYYQNPYIQSKTIKTNLTLDEARQHCKDPETSSETCTDQAEYDKYGDWFDGYAKE